MNLPGLLTAALDELLGRIRPVLAVVMDKRRGAGAGILVGNGLVLTNAHVAGRGRSLQVVLADDKNYPAKSWPATRPWTWPCCKSLPTVIRPRSFPRGHGTLARWFSPSGIPGASATC